MLTEVSGRGERLLASPEVALELTGGLGLVFHRMTFQTFFTFHDLSAKLTLKSLANFRVVSDSWRGTFLVALHVNFEIGTRSEGQLAYAAFNESWLCGLVFGQVPLNFTRPVKAFATQLAHLWPDGVHLLPVQFQVTTWFALVQAISNLARSNSSHVLLDVIPQVQRRGESFSATGVLAREDARLVRFQVQQVPTFDFEHFTAVATFELVLNRDFGFVFQQISLCFVRVQAVSAFEWLNFFVRLLEVIFETVGVFKQLLASILNALEYSGSVREVHRHVNLEAAIVRQVLSAQQARVKHGAVQKRFLQSRAALQNFLQSDQFCWRGVQVLLPVFLQFLRGERNESGFVEIEIVLARNQRPVGIEMRLQEFYAFEALTAKLALVTLRVDGAGLLRGYQFQLGLGPRSAAAAQMLLQLCLSRKVFVAILSDVWSESRTGYQYNEVGIVHEKFA
jgi:hypothetical protein